jgi:hypothetical protein
MMVGGMLFLIQTHGLMHDVFVDELAFSRNAHDQAQGRMFMDTKGGPAACAFCSKPFKGTAFMDSKPVPEGPTQPYVIIDENDSNKVAEAEEPDSAQWGEPITISIPAKSDTRYKFYLIEGATMHYSWKADMGELLFDFHGEPTGAKAGYFESFVKETSDQFEGSVTAPFAGTIGWYWKNDTPRAVVIALRVNGFGIKSWPLDDDSKSVAPLSQSTLHKTSRKEIDL